MTKTINVTDAMILELSVVETAVPAHTMWMAANAVVTSGYVLRPDIVQQLNAASVAPFAALRDQPLEVIKRAASRTDKAAHAILNKLSPDNTLHAFYSACMFCLKLVDEGMLADAQSMAVLTSMVVMEDLKAEGSMDDYRFHERILDQAAKSMIDAARAEGLYRSTQPAPAVIH